MNEYRFNKNVHIPQMRSEDEEVKRKPMRSNRTAVVISITACVIAVVCAATTIFTLAGYKKNSARTALAVDNRQKDDISALISGGNNEALSVSEIYDAVSPSVVGIVTRVTVSSLFGQSTGQGSGSGVIISSDGYIMTNNHVIENARDINVVLPSGEKYYATLVGNDEKTDLAVVKIDEEGLPAATLGNSDTVKTGELAVAIGNPLGQELAGSLTAGVVSAVNRNINVQGKNLNLIQTDAAINPGNSGGALVNCFGEVIGINTVKVSSTSIEGIGFAIPISEAMPIVNSLVDNGRVLGRTYIGITGENAPYGVVIKTVTENSPASKAGLKADDLIVKVNGQTISSVQEINDIKEKLKVGDTITLTLYRDGELTDVEIVLEESIS
jgi:serine protease Do